MTVVGSSLALDRVAVTTALPLFSAISVADVVKVTTGASSSLILTSSEDSAESSIFWGSAKAIEIVSISDKTIHFIAYFFLMLSWLYVFFKKKSFSKNVKFIFIGCIVFGIIIEILQGVTTTYRTLSFLDVAANTLGVLFASTVFHFFEKKIRLF